MTVTLNGKFAKSPNSWGGSSGDRLSPTITAEQGQPWQAGFDQPCGFWHLWGWRLHGLSMQPAPGFNHPQSREVFLMGCWNCAHWLLSWHCWDDSGFIFTCPKPGVGTHGEDSPWAFRSPGCAVSLPAFLSPSAWLLLGFELFDKRQPSAPKRRLKKTYFSPSHEPHERDFAYLTAY